MATDREKNGAAKSDKKLPQEPPLAAPIPDHVLGGNEEALFIPEGMPVPEGEEVIDRGIPETGPEASGTSAINWAALVEEAPAAIPEAGVHVDSPSDADILRHVVSEDPESDSDIVDLVAEPDVTSEPPTDPPLAMPLVEDVPFNGEVAAEADVIGNEVFAGTGLSSVVNLSAEPELSSEPATDPPLPRSADAHLEEPAPEPTAVVPPPPPLAEEDAAFGTETMMVEELLGTDHPATRHSGVETFFASSEPPAELPEEAVVDLNDLGELGLPTPHLAPAPDSGIDLIEEQLLKEHGSGLNLGAEGDPPSGRDLIAEEVESGVGLNSPKVEIGEEAAEIAEISEEDEIVDMPDLAATMPSDAASSALDLGGPTPTVFADHGDMEAALASDSPSGIFDLGDEAAVDFNDMETLPPGAAVGRSGSAIDLGGRPGGRDGSGGSSLRESGEAVSDSDENFSSGVASDRGLGTIHATPDSMVRVADLPEPGMEPELDLAAMAEDGDDGAVAVIEDEEPEEKPKRKPELVRGGKGGWIGGTVLGTMIGAVACVGLAFVDVNLPQMAREATGMVPPKNEMPETTNPWPVVQDLVRSGDFEKAKDQVEKADETKPEQVALRGEVRWLSYLQKQRTDKAPLKADDPAVVNALKDLEKAGTADAIFWLGQLRESLGDDAAARKTFTDGADKFKADPLQKRRFEAALNRLDLRAVQKPAEPAGMSRAPRRADEALMVALLFLAFQEGVPEVAPNAPVADTDEAGFEFWKAAKAARDRKFTEALRLLDRARFVHDQRRILQLRKPQNPLSDPTEEIFLKACDELKASWEVQEKLSKGGYLAEGKLPGKAIDDLVKVAKDADEGNKALAEKLVTDKVIEKPEDLAKGVEQLLTDRKAGNDLAEKLAKDKLIEKPEEFLKGVEALAAAKKAADALAEKLVKDKVIEKPEDVAKGIDALLAQKKADDELADKLVKDKIVEKADLAKGVEQLLTDRKAAQDKEKELNTKLAEADASLKEVGEELVAAKYVEPKAPKAALVQGVKDALKLAAEKDPGGQIRTLQANLNKAAGRLKQAKLPADMLDLWQQQLRIGGGAELAAAATADAGKVSADPDAAPALKGKAIALKGLALWSQEKFAEAKPVLQKALTDLDPGAAVWRERVTNALEEASDPLAFYTQRAETLKKAGDTDAALEAMGQIIEKTPDDEKGPAYLARAQMYWELAQASAKGKRVAAADENLVAARQDAAKATKAGLAAGHHLAGVLAEEAYDFKTAEASYRAALEAHPEKDTEGFSYRAALARILVKERTFRAPAPKAAPMPEEAKPAEEKKPEEKKPEEKKPEEKKPEEKKGDISRLPDSLRAMVLLTVLGFQAPVGQLTPKQAEALKLAEEILAAPPDSVPFEARAQALAIKGLWTRALNTYVEGLQPHLKREHAEALLDLVQKHPVLKRPDSLATPNSFDGERRYGAGLRNYFNRRYKAAEQEFVAAIEQDNQDARYFYFLGLSKLAQNNTDAQEDFEQGAKLEAQSRPSSTTISISLERVQGRARRVLNEARDGVR